MNAACVMPLTTTGVHVPAVACTCVEGAPVQDCAPAYRDRTAAVEEEQVTWDIPLTLAYANGWHRPGMRFWLGEPEQEAPVYTSAA